MPPRPSRLFPLLLILALAGCASGGGRSDPATDTAPLERLLAGNRRFASGQAEHPRASAARRAELATTQRPFAVVLACADSRVAPEILFDQGLGDLFTVRVAGNVASDEVLGSIEYAVEHLGARLIVVLGHERCGAVTAALAGGEPEGHVGSLVRAIVPHLRGIARQGEEALDTAVRANARAVAAGLRASRPVLHEAQEKHGLEIAGARYDLDTGLVELLER